MTQIRRLALLLALGGCRAPLVVPPIADSPAEIDTLQSESESEPELAPRSDPGELPRLLPALTAGLGPLPLERTDIHARVIGDVAHVRVRQSFRNPSPNALPVRYVFEPPELAEVDGLRVGFDRATSSTGFDRATSSTGFDEHNITTRTRETTGGHERGQARDHPLRLDFDIPGGARVDVEVEVLQPVTRDELGERELALPLLARQPDAGPVTFALEVEAGVPIDRWRAVGATLTATPTEHGFSATLTDELVTGDLVVRWSPASVAAATLYTTPTSADSPGYFMLLLRAAEVDPASREACELIFVIDTSPSMAEGLERSKRIIESSLARLGPQDSFNLMTSTGKRLFDRAQANAKPNRNAAKRFVEALETEPGAVLHPAIKAALEPAIAAGERRLVVFVTDGAIADEPRLLAATRDLVDRADLVGAQALVFGLGLDSARDHRALITLARAGHTRPLIGDDIVEQLVRYIDPPAMAEFIVDWPGASIEAGFPRVREDLRPGDERVLTGSYRGTPSHAPVIHARVPGQTQLVEIPVDVVDHDVDARLIEVAWARRAVDNLVQRRAADGIIWAEFHARVLALGLEHGLVTGFTDMVAIDSRAPERNVRTLVESADEYGVFFYSLPHRLCGLSGDPIHTFSTASLIDEPTMLPLGHASWAPDSALRIARIQSSVGVDHRAVKRALRAHGAEFEACHEIHRSKARQRRLRYRLVFAASGRLASVDLLDGSFGDDGETCLADVFRRVTWPGLPSARSVVEVDLHLRLR